MESISRSEQKDLHKKVELRYLNRLNVECGRERARKQELVDAATGWFSNDELLMRQARELKMPGCEALSAAQQASGSHYLFS